MNIILFSPNNYSNYSLAVYELLLKNNLRIENIFCLNNSIIRVFKLFKKSPFEFSSKIFNRLFFPNNYYKTNINIEGLLDFRNKLKVNLKSLNETRNFNTKLSFFENFNNSDCIKEVKKLNPDLIIFTGGGIMSKAMLDIPKIGILNCHMGILPDYRGMHVAEWTILNDDYDKIGCTCHLMEMKVDTGRVLDIRKIKLDHIKSINELYSVFEKNMCESILSSVIKLKKNRNYCKFISKETPLYYRMKNYNKKKVLKKILNYNK